RDWSSDVCSSDLQTFLGKFNHYRSHFALIANDTGMVWFHGCFSWRKICAIGAGNFYLHLWGNAISERNSRRNKSQSYWDDDIGGNRYFSRLHLFGCRRFWSAGNGLLLGTGNSYRDYAFGTLVRNAFYYGSFKSIAVIGGTFT